MSREKQIEGMAEILRKVCEPSLLDECDSKNCNECMAEAIYNAGYRKQSEDVPDTNVGCKFCENDSLLVDIVCYIPTDDGSSIDIPVRYCPHCGAKMKGGE